MKRPPPDLVLTNDQAVLLMNAWRRLAAMLAVLNDPLLSDISGAVREFVEPALRDLDTLLEAMSPAERRQAHRSPAAWHADFHRPPWCRRSP